MGKIEDSEDEDSRNAIEIQSPKGLRSMVRPTLKRVGSIVAAQVAKTSLDLVRRTAGSIAAGLDNATREIYRAEADMLSSAALRDGKLAAVGIAQDLLLLFSDRLRAIPHFGALQSVSAFDLTRMHYVSLHLHLLHEFKKTHRGFGLGSAVKGTPMTGLVMAQIWVILLNAGHLFGTFATERAVLYKCVTDQKVADSLLGQIHQKLRPHAKEMLFRKRIEQFHYVLACVAVNALPAQVKDNAINGLQQFFERAKEHDSIYWAFQRTRNLAMTRVHRIARLGTAWIEANPVALVSELREGPLVGYDPIVDDNQPLVQFLNATDAYFTESVYSSPKAAWAVLQHLREFESWWNDCGNSERDKIEELHRKPAKWPDLPMQQGNVQRLRVKSAGHLPWHQIVHDFRLNMKAWDHTGFLVTPTSMNGEEQHLIDLFYNDAPSIRASWPVINNLFQHARANDKDENVFRSVVHFLFLNSKWVFAPHIMPVLYPGRRTGMSSDPISRYGYSVIADSVSRLANMLEQVVHERVDQDRAAELNALVAYMRDGVQYRDGGSNQSIYVCLLGRTELVSADTDQIVTDIDAILVEFGHDFQIWTMLEHKSRGQSSQAQFEDRLKKVLLRSVQPTPIVLSSTLSGKPGSVSIVSVRLTELEDGSVEGCEFLSAAVPLSDGLEKLT